MPTAATVYISESNGAGEVVTDNITNMSFGSLDAPNLVASDHPVILGEYPYIKYFRFKVQSLGDSTTIKDLRYWKSAGTYVTGEGIFQIARYIDTVVYATPVQTAIGGFAAAMPTSDPGVPMVGIVGSDQNGVINAGTPVPAYSNYFKMVTHSNAITTPAGPANTKTMLLQYDET